MKEKLSVLITGGPVHAHLDRVKIITNRFKGGLIAKLAEVLKWLAIDRGLEIDITYLCSKGSVEPKGVTILYHDGIDDYMGQVLKLAPQMDGVILGAAVANLIPANPIPGKFPSHKYKEGDIIPIPFKIAPRVIDRVKEVAPQTHLFGFKLLSGAWPGDLIDAAHEICIDAKATAIFANDEKSLKNKYAVTKEKAVIPLSLAEYPEFILGSLLDEYYKTVIEEGVPIPDEAKSKFTEACCKYIEPFTEITVNNDKYIFGSVAIRLPNGGFLASARNKKHPHEYTVVTKVDHENRLVYVGGRKATLNAPLLARLFENPEVDVIIHSHDGDWDIPQRPYTHPGTVRDTNNGLPVCFNINGHGAYYLLDKGGKAIV